MAVRHAGGTNRTPSGNAQARICGRRRLFEDVVSVLHSLISASPASAQCAQEPGVFPLGSQETQRVEAVVWGGREGLSPLARATGALPGDGLGLEEVSGRAGFVSTTDLASRRSGAERARGEASARAAGGLLCLSALVATFASCITSRLAAMADAIIRKPSRKRRACHGVTTPTPEGSRQRRESCRMVEGKY
jgi:hypothetical protein